MERTLFHSNTLAILSRKAKKKLGKMVFEATYKFYKNLGRHQCFPKASAAWLIHREILYGGMQKNVERKIVSPNDPRNEAELQHGGMRGGDRMLFHKYAAEYSRYLKQFEFNEKLVVAEIGILRGNGLAIWCDLFPNARVLGLDIDIGHFEKNKANLLSLGAFSLNSAEIHTYDQFKRGEEVLTKILKGDTIDICIDDGCHLDEAILCTIESAMPHMSKKFVYFVEDNSNVHEKIRARFPELNIVSRGLLTILHRGL